MPVAVGIPRGLLVTVTVLQVVLVVVGIWMTGVDHIADAVGRCLAAERPSVWADGRCRHLMAYAPAVAVVSLLLMLVLCIREAQAKSKAYYLYLPDVGIAVGPESRRLRESDAMALDIMIVMYLYCFLVMMLGAAVRNVGSRRQLQHLADKRAAALVESGSAITQAGCLASWLEYCCLVFPYMMLRLRRFVRANYVEH